GAVAAGAFTSTPTTPKDSTFLTLCFRSIRLQEQVSAAQTSTGMVSPSCFITGLDTNWFSELQIWTIRFTPWLKRVSPFAPNQPLVSVLRKAGKRTTAQKK